MTGGAAQIVDKESAMKLAALRGQVWRFFGSSRMTNWLTDVSMFFCTEGPAITVSGWTDFFDFEGEGDTYALLKIDDGAADFEEAKKAGRSYPTQSGQNVNDVLILRETVVETRGGQVSWRYVADIAIVFQLSGGVVAVAKVSHHTELLGIAKAPSMDELRIDQVNSYWQDRHGVAYTVDRRVIRIEDLLGETDSIAAQFNPKVE